MRVPALLALGAIVALAAFTRSAPVTVETHNLPGPNYSVVVFVHQVPDSNGPIDSLLTSLTCLTPAACPVQAHVLAGPATVDSFLRPKGIAGATETGKVLFRGARSNALGPIGQIAWSFTLPLPVMVADSVATH